MSRSRRKVAQALPASLWGTDERASSGGSSGVAGEGATRVLLSVEEAATRLGIARSSAYELVARGELRSLVIGKVRRVPVAALDGYIHAKIAAERAARSAVHGAQRGGAQQPQPHGTITARGRREVPPLADDPVFRAASARLARLFEESRVRKIGARDVESVLAHIFTAIERHIGDGGDGGECGECAKR